MADAVVVTAARVSSATYREAAPRKPAWRHHAAIPTRGRPTKHIQKRLGPSGSFRSLNGSNEATLPKDSKKSIAPVIRKNKPTASSARPTTLRTIRVSAWLSTERLRVVMFPLFLRAMVTATDVSNVRVREVDTFADWVD